MHRLLHAKFVDRPIATNVRLVMVIPLQVDHVSFVNISPKKSNAKHVLTIFMSQMIASNANKH